MSPAAAPTGRLYLVPTPLDFGCGAEQPLADSLPLGTLRTAARLPSWISENAKSTRAFLRRVAQVVPLAQPIQALAIQEIAHALHKKGDHHVTLAPDAARALLADALAGRDMGLISEAGMPALADPGSSIVHAAHALGIAVVPLAGPVSIALALAASGLNGQDFAFVGYLPRELAARGARIRALEALALRSGQTQLFIETPYRNAALLQALLATLRPATRLCVATGLTLPEQAVWSAPARDWLRRQLPPLPLPAVFALGA